MNEKSTKIANFETIFTLFLRPGWLIFRNFGCVKIKISPPSCRGCYAFLAAQIMQSVINF